LYTPEESRSPFCSTRRGTDPSKALDRESDANLVVDGVAETKRLGQDAAGAIPVAHVPGLQALALQHPGLEVPITGLATQIDSPPEHIERSDVVTPQ
jgi:hypothetical protein